MSLNRRAILLLSLGCAAVPLVEAQPPILTEPRRPFAFRPGAEDKVWSAVVLASNVAKGEKPAALPPELAPFSVQLAKCFGYHQYRILGSATKAMDGEVERWLVPTQNFWLGAKATRSPGGYLVDIEFFHDKRSILSAQAKVGHGSPIFIRGPMHVRGQIIMVFEVKR